VWSKLFGREGETDQLARDVADHVKALRRYALVLVANSNEAGDLVQECLRRALAEPQKRRSVRDLRAFLFKTLHLVFVENNWQRQVRQPGIVSDQGISKLSVAASQLTRPEFRDLIAALQNLPVQQREVVLLIGLEDMSYTEAACILGVSVGTVMTRLSRGREALCRLTDRSVEAGHWAINSYATKFKLHRGR
jgi:RNA polymerase sigma-70 factor (ECF subfamily)